MKASSRAKKCRWTKSASTWKSNPKEGEALRLKNRSYVFFTETSLGTNDECLGAQGIPLTPFRSIAVDPSAHVYGTPIWVEAELPINGLAPVDHVPSSDVRAGHRLRHPGPARADIYFGHGEDIEHIAGRIKQYGHFVMLVPKSVSVTGTQGPPFTPLPRPRPPEIGPVQAGAAVKHAGP